MNRRSCPWMLLFAWLPALVAQAAPAAPAVAPAPAARSPVARVPAANNPTPGPSWPLVFGWRDGDQTVLLEVAADKVTATVGGQPLAKERVRRTGARVQVLDPDGGVAAQVSLTGSGGTLQTYPDRHKPVLGLRLAVPEVEVATALGFQPGELRRVASVTPGLAAARAGLQPGDVVVALDGARPVTETRLHKLLDARHVGDRLPLRVQRGTRTLDIEIRLEPAPASELTTTWSSDDPPFVEFHGPRMVVLPPGRAPSAPSPATPPEPTAPATPPGAAPASPSWATPGGAAPDPLQELRSVRERLERVERLLQRLTETRGQGEPRAPEEAKDKDERGKDAGDRKDKDVKAREVRPRGGNR